MNGKEIMLKTEDAKNAVFARKQYQIKCKCNGMTERWVHLGGLFG